MHLLKACLLKQFYWIQNLLLFYLQKLYINTIADIFLTQIIYRKYWFDMLSKKMIYGFNIFLSEKGLFWIIKFCNYSLYFYLCNYILETRIYSISPITLYDIWMVLKLPTNPLVYTLQSCIHIVKRLWALFTRELTLLLFNLYKVINLKPF